MVLEGKNPEELPVSWAQSFYRGLMVLEGQNPEKLPVSLARSFYRGLRVLEGRSSRVRFRKVIIFFVVRPSIQSLWSSRVRIQKNLKYTRVDKEPGSVTGTIGPRGLCFRDATQQPTDA